MMTKKNIAMRESNDNIDHKKFELAWQMKQNIFLNSMHQRRFFSNIFDNRIYFGPYFWP